MSDWHNALSADDLGRDDPPEFRTVPANPKVHQRFMVGTSPGFWDVYDWVPGICTRCGGSGQIDPDTVCPCDPPPGPVPEMTVSGLLEHDARMLVFGSELVRLTSLQMAESLIERIRALITEIGP